MVNSIGSEWYLPHTEWLVCVYLHMFRWFEWTSALWSFARRYCWLAILQWNGEKHVLTLFSLFRHFYAIFWPFYPAFHIWAWLSYMVHILRQVLCVILAFKWCECVHCYTSQCGKTTLTSVEVLVDNQWLMGFLYIILFHRWTIRRWFPLYVSQTTSMTPMRSKWLMLWEDKLVISRRSWLNL